MSLLDEIIRKRDDFEGAGFAGLKGPEGELEEGDQVIGILSDDLKLLYFVMEAAATEEDEFQKEVMAKLAGKDIDCLPEDEQKAILQGFGLVANKYVLARACFWCSVRAAFPEQVNAEEEEIVLRSGWQVVTCKPKRQPRVPIAISILGFNRPVHDLGPDDAPDDVPVA